jgi:FKBP-type peptidyl-prolyl cis-trans isomerase
MSVVMRLIHIVMMLLLAFCANAAGGFLTTPGGALYKDMVIGGGPAAAIGDVATIHFRSWLDDDGEQGREFYNSRAQREPVSFLIGTERVMPGWNDGIIGMREGGKRLLKLPPELGFGAKGSAGVVPPNSGLIFMMELISLRKSGD